MDGSMWHVICDMWHVTCDMCFYVCIWCACVVVLSPPPSPLFFFYVTCASVHVSDVCVLCSFSPPFSPYFCSMWHVLLCMCLMHVCVCILPMQTGLSSCRHHASGFLYVTTHLFTHTFTGYAGKRHPIAHISSVFPFLFLLSFFYVGKRYPIQGRPGR
jgi:hypothetical protein